jgi:FAD/FMN-containing dehydrogenase
MSYEGLNRLLDGAFPRGALNYWKANFLTSLSDDAIDAMIERFALCPSPMGQLLLEHFHGAATRVRPTDTAFPHRAPGYNLLVLGQWVDPAAGAANVGWVRDTFAAMARHFAPGKYVNYLNADELGHGDALRAAFGPNLARLQELKQRYDPENVFHLNQNVKP